METAQQRFTAEDRRQQIVDVATELFAAQGYEGTTTREIAHRASVNEAIIFRHFPSKEDLYWEIIEQKIRNGGGKVKLQEILAAGDDPRTTFVNIAERILRRRSEDQSLSRLLLFSALENHRLSARFFKVYVAEYYEAISEYIRGKIVEGSFRDVDPVLASRGFLGMVIYHSMIQDLFGGSKCQEYDPKQVSEIIVSIWLDGMAAGKATSSPTRVNRLQGNSESAGARPESLKRNLRKTER